jgi:hypothetical protein
MKTEVMPSTTLPASPSWEYSNGFWISEDTDNLVILFKYTEGDETGFYWYLEWQANGTDDWHKVAAVTGASPSGVQNLRPIKGFWDKSDKETDPDFLQLPMPRRNGIMVPGMYRIRVQGAGSPKAPGSVSLAIEEVKV